VKKTTAVRELETPAPIPESEWAAWPDEKLVELRLCDLDVKIISPLP